MFGVQFSDMPLGDRFGDTPLGDQFGDTPFGDRFGDTLGTDLVTRCLGTSSMICHLGTDSVTCCLGTDSMTCRLGTNLVTHRLGTDSVIHNLGTDSVTCRLGKGVQHLRRCVRPSGPLSTLSAKACAHSWARGFHSQRLTPRAPACVDNARAKMLPWHRSYQEKTGSIQYLTGVSCYINCDTGVQGQCDRAGDSLLSQKRPPKYVSTVGRPNQFHVCK